MAKRITMDPGQTPENYMLQMRERARSKRRGDAEYSQNITLLAGTYAKVGIRVSNEWLIAALNHSATLKTAVQELHDTGILTHQAYITLLTLVDIQDCQLCDVADQQARDSN